MYLLGGVFAFLAGLCFIVKISQSLKFWLSFFCQCCGLMTILLSFFLFKNGHFFRPIAATQLIGIKTTNYSQTPQQNIIVAPNPTEQFIAINGGETPLVATPEEIQEDAALKTPLPAPINLPTSPQYEKYEQYKQLVPTFFVDKYAISFALMVAFLWIAASFYAVKYMQTLYPARQQEINKFMFFYHCSIAITLLFAFSANLMTAFIFYEILSFVTIPLVCFNKDTEAKRATIIYIISLIGLSSLLLFPAILIAINKIGIINFFESKSLNGFATSKSYGLIAVLFAMMVLGVAKSAMFPFFRWLVGAMVAPTPVSALLHAVAVVKVGVFFILRIVDGVFGTANLKAISMLGFFYGRWMFFVCCFAIVACSGYAVLQKNIKKMLAYSTISQLSYILLALSTFNQSGVDTAFLQIVAHAFAKISLFFIAGAVYIYGHNPKITAFNALAKQSPVLAFCLTVSVFSIVGLPFTLGYVAKLSLFTLVNNLESVVMQFTLFISLFFTSIYLFGLVYRAYFVQVSACGIEKLQKHKISASLKLAILMPTVATIVMYFIF